MSKTPTPTYVLVKCVSCKHEWKVYADTPKPGGMPECPQCYSIGVPVKAAR